MIRTAFIFLYVFPATAVFGIIAIIVSFFSRTGNPVHIIARIWSKSILFVSGIKVDDEPLRREAAAFEENISAIVSADPDLSEYVRQLKRREFAQ